MNTVDQTFDQINVEDIFWNCLTDFQKKNLSSIVGNLILCRNKVINAITHDSAGFYTCIEIESTFYEDFIDIAISRTPTGKLVPGYNVLTVDEGSTGSTDNELRVKILDALIGQIRTYQSGHKNS